MNKFFVSLISTLFLILSSSFFIVHEGERGILLQFGKVLKNHEQKTIVYNPGFHFKFPFFETVKILNSRLHTVNIDSDHLITKEKKDLIIDSYIKWRISDFSRYYLSTGGGDKFQAEAFLKRKFSDFLHSKIINLNIKEIISDSKRKLITDVLNSLNKNEIDNEKESLHNTNSITSFGIEVLDVRIKKIDFPITVFNAICNRMRSEKEFIAKKYRFQGREKAEKLKSEANYKASMMLAEARKKALIIKGEGEAKVIKIFSENFSSEPDFYFFIRSLQAYENSFKNNENIMLIDSNNNFFQYMKNNLNS
ncbi:protease modulator HflC [Buchnera aphidicola (Muscaphis stroyani)]|uniref:Protein HflC n=1 Tax=Buchnera aphidicola (Muscaphis stroyani) TaxID=1241869 RepID=A0A4D6YFS0_9GAMM|nr:protease modulator HflC [Buchnera aphidicola]QCI24598.1 protease modulator HflC [Buchnera aphidicola (Muscaphis stroyani)]